MVIGDDERHVGHRLARDQRPLRRRRQHERRERARAPPGQPRHELPHRPHRRQRSRARPAGAPPTRRASRPTIWFAGACAHSRPNSFIDSAISQSVSTGLDQNSARSCGEPGHHRLIEVVALRHLARDLAVVRLPRIPQPVVAGERDVEDRAQAQRARTRCASRRCRRRDRRTVSFASLMKSTAPRAARKRRSMPLAALAHFAKPSTGLKKR